MDRGQWMDSEWMEYTLAITWKVNKPNCFEGKYTLVLYFTLILAFLNTRLNPTWLFIQPKNKFPGGNLNFS